MKEHDASLTLLDRCSSLDVKVLNLCGLVMSNIGVDFSLLLLRIPSAFLHIQMNLNC